MSLKVYPGVCTAGNDFICLRYLDIFGSLQNMCHPIARIGSL